MLCKKHVITGLHIGPILLVVRAEFWASPFGLILVAIGPFGFSIFTTPMFCYRVIFGNLDFIRILITKYTIGSLKAMGNFLFIYSFIFIICF